MRHDSALATSSVRSHCNLIYKSVLYCVLFSLSVNGRPDVDSLLAARERKRKFRDEEHGKVTHSTFDRKASWLLGRNFDVYELTASSCGSTAHRGASLKSRPPCSLTDSTSLWHGQRLCLLTQRLCLLNRSPQVVVEKPRRSCRLRRDLRRRRRERRRSSSSRSYPSTRPSTVPSRSCTSGTFLL
jgi:hypothetical protein